MGRKKKTIHYLYKTTCNVTGRYYIGMHSTNDLNDGYLGSGTRLRRSIRKYGEENHLREILSFYDTRELLIEGEKEIITEELIDDLMCMNLKGGGEGGFISEEQQRHRSQCGGKSFSKKLLEDNKFREKHIKNVTKNIVKAHEEGKIRYNTFKDKTHSEESKLKISESLKLKQKGKLNSQYGTMWITNDIDNKKIEKNGIIPKGWRRGRVVN